MDPPYPYPLPTLGPFPTPEPTITNTPTPSPLEKVEIVEGVWKNCRADWVDQSSKFSKVPELAGVLLRTGDALWRIDEHGENLLLSCMPRSELSRSGDRISFVYENEFWFYDRTTGKIQKISDDPQSAPYFYDWSPDERYFIFNKLVSGERIGEIWVYDTISGERRQITNSPQLSKFGLRVWPKYPEWVVFNAFIPEIPPGPGVNGAVVLAKMNGTGERILSEDGQFSFRSDGSTLVYRASEGFMLLDDPGKAPDQFRTDLFSIKDWNLRGASDFVWSPNGKYLAMSAVANNQFGESTGLAILNLSTNTARFLHPFTPIGFGGSPLGFGWSPDSRYLSVDIRDENPQKSGVWLLAADGTKEIKLVDGYCSLWSPEGDRVICKQITDNQFWIYDVDTGDRTDVKLPEAVLLLKWDRLPDPWVEYTHPMGVTFEYPSNWKVEIVHNSPTMSVLRIHNMLLEIYKSPVDQKQTADPHTWQPNEGGYTVQCEIPVVVDGAAGYAFLWGDDQGRPSLQGILYNEKFQLDVRLYDGWGQAASSGCNVQEFDRILEEEHAIFLHIIRSMKFHPPVVSESTLYPTRTPTPANAIP